jgi:hypothetical protein
VSVPIEPLLLVSTDMVAVSLGGFVAYPAGTEFTLAVRRRSGAEDSEWIDRQMHLRRRRGGDVPPEFLRLGVEFADARRATNLGWHAQFEPGEGAADRPVLVDRGGGGGGTRFDQRYWLWPLPPPGRLSFVAEWPREGVVLTRVDVDASSFVEAATRARTLWEPTASPHGGVTRQSQFSSYSELST